MSTRTQRSDHAGMLELAWCSITSHAREDHVTWLPEELSVHELRLWLSLAAAPCFDLALVIVA